MSMNSALQKTKRASKDLRVQWSEVKSVWYDENSRRFEEQYIVPLLARLRTVELTMSHMASILQKARRDCE
ncbi:MAG: hypothetical protein ABIG44_07660 [Planctomycetota bacterium]